MIRDLALLYLGGLIPSTIGAIISRYVHPQPAHPALQVACVLVWPVWMPVESIALVLRARAHGP